MLLSLGLILMAGLLAAAAAGVHPGRKCYDAGGEEIPCDSNYLQTQAAAKATARNSGPAVPAVAPSATPSPTATPTSTAIPTQITVPTLIQTQEAAPPAAAAPQAAAPRASTSMLLIPLLMLGCGAVLAVIVLFVLYRWLSGRRNTPPGPPN
jgi:hypothetical protein